MYYFNKQNTFLDAFAQRTKLGYDKIGSKKPIFWFIIYLLSLALQLAPMILGSIAIGVLVGVYLIATGNMDKLMIIQAGPWAQWLSLITTTGFVILSFFLYVRFAEKRPFSTIGLAGPSKLKKYLIGGAVAIVMQLSYFAIVLMAGWAEVVSEPIHATTALGTSAIGFVLLFLLGFMVQGASEEVVVRGWMLPVLSKHYKVSTAIASSSVFFGLLHLTNPNISEISVVNLVLYGVFASLYAIYDGGLWGIFAQHSIWNWFMGNVLGMPVSGMIVGGTSIMETRLSGPEWITGGAFGPEGGVIVTVILVVSIGILIKLLIGKGVLTKEKPEIEPTTEFENE